MPIGVILNVLAVVFGGWVGSFIGNRLSEDLKRQMTTVFGICALSMGVSSVILMKNLPAVIFAVIIGTLFGTVLHIDAAITRGTTALLAKLKIRSGSDPQLMITAMVLFCSSGTGIYGSLTSGMTGDHSILIAKAILDFFTAVIFACQLKKAVMLIGVPQLVIMLALFFSARLLLPLVSDAMIADFKAAGGIVLLATGITIMKIKEIPVANMLLSMVLVMPFSALWMNCVVPIL